MNSSIISAKAAKELDTLAQSINPILFWTCNFEPMISYAISEDARFFIGIQDLYKFAFDTNCVLKGIASNNKNSICQNLLPSRDAEILRNATDTVQMLRAVLSHNHSDLNGKMDSAAIDAYNGWIREKLGKDTPVAPGDFSELNAALRDIGADLIRLSEQVIACIKARQDVDVITKKWIERTLQWYCTGTHQNYYRSQLCDLYYAEGCERRRNFANNVDEHELVSRVNRWIKNQITREFDVKLKDLIDERSRIKSLIDDQSPRALKLQKACPEQFEKVTETWKHRLGEIEVEIDVVQGQRDQFLRRCHEKYRTEIDYFFNGEKLFSQLYDTLERLRDNGENFTLLPQDFLFSDIMHNFQGVRVPNRDFSPL